MSTEEQDGLEGEDVILHAPVEIHPDAYKVGDTKYSADLVEDLQIDRHDLASSYESHSEKFAFYATAYEMALSYENKMKVKLERAYAILDQKARGMLKASGEKVTEKMIENVVITSEDYKNIQQEYFDASLNAGLLKSARDAMIHRKDMLISLGANYRAEVNAEPSLRAKASSSEEMQAAVKSLLKK